MAAKQVEGQTADSSLTVESGKEAIFGLLSDDLDMEVEQIEEGEGEDDSDDPELEDVEDDDFEEEEEGDDPDDTLDDEVDDEADEATEDDAPLQTKHKVKVDGEEIEVTLDEALAGYQRQQAFTKKTQALAEERNALQTEAQATVQARQEYLDRLEIVEKALTGGATEPDWAQVKKDNPAKYAEMRTAWQERQEQLSSLQAEQQRVRKEQKDALETERERILTAEAERLEAAIPEWAADPDAKRTEQSKIVQFAQNTYGFTPDDLGSVVDHRVILLLRDAMKYQDLQAQGEAVKQVAKERRRKSPTLQPGSPKARAGKKQAKAASARKRLAKSGRIDDAAATFFEMFDD